MQFESPFGGDRCPAKSSRQLDSPSKRAIEAVCASFPARNDDKKVLNTTISLTYNGLEGFEVDDLFEDVAQSWAPLFFLHDLSLEKFEAVRVTQLSC